jgi:hypothetical protein
VAVVVAGVVEPMGVGLLLDQVVLAVVAQEMHLEAEPTETLTQVAAVVGEASQQPELAPALAALA